MKKMFFPAVIFCCLTFCFGALAARLADRVQNHFRPPEAVHTSADGNWGLSFQDKGKTPVGNAAADYLRQFHAWYAADPEDNTIYLTFDAGFENGNTAPILDALKKHHAPATFFLVGNYLETSPELVKRMIAEGHTVGNHTFHHPDMSKLSSPEAFSKELTDLEALYQSVTGQTMKKYYRPPQGKYSESNLKMASDMGYETFFWSLAYVDWYENKQPTREEALEKLLGRIHPGAIVLLHSTSKTNGQILDELLTRWEEMGYRFGSLDELVKGRDGSGAEAGGIGSGDSNSGTAPPSITFYDPPADETTSSGTSRSRSSSGFSTS